MDTGCSRSIVHVSCCEKWKKNPVGMITISGEEWRCEGTGTVLLHLSNGSSTVVDVTVTTSKPLGFTFALGMDGIRALWLTFRVACALEEKNLRSAGAAVTALGVDEHDFRATYDPVANSWTAEWKWSDGKQPSVLEKRVESYHIPRGAREMYEKELLKWIEEGCSHTMKINTDQSRA